jgi:hypothetical protein
MEMKGTLSFVLMMVPLGLAVLTVGNAHAQSSSVTFDGRLFIPRCGTLLRANDAAPV